MKIEPNGNIPPNKIIALGCKYHTFSGIGLGMGLIRQGCSTRLLLLQFFPMIAPNKVSGKQRKVHIARIAI